MKFSMKSPAQKCITYALSILIFSSAGIAQGSPRVGIAAVKHPGVHQADGAAADPNTVGDVWVALPNGRKQMLTESGFCFDAKAAPVGQEVGWIECQITGYQDRNGPFTPNVGYPVVRTLFPAALVVWRPGHPRRRIVPEKLYDVSWKFVRGGAEVATRSVGSHGPTYLQLFDAATGRLVASCMDYQSNLPSWTHGLVANESPVKRPHAVRSDRREVRLTPSLRTQLTDIALSLEEGYVPSFQNGKIANHALVKFGVLMAIFHHRSGLFPNSQEWAWLPQRYVDAEVARHFGVKVHHETLLVGPNVFLFHDRAYRVQDLEPSSYAEAGYQVSRLVHIGAGRFRAYIIGNGPGNQGNPVPYETMVLELEKRGIGPATRFIVVGYELHNIER